MKLSLYHNNYELNYLAMSGINQFNIIIEYRIT